MAVAVTSAPRLPAPARLLIATVAVAGAGVLVLRGVELAHSSASTLGAALFIAVAVAAADQFTLTVPHGGEEENFALTDAVWVAAIVLAPAGAPTLGAAAGALAWQAVRRVAPAKIAFNVGQVALALTAAELLWGLPGRQLSPDEPAAWGLAAVAAAAAFAVNESTVALVIALAQRQPVRPILLGSLRVSALLWAGNVAIGLLAVVVWSAHPVGILLVAVPLAILYLAYRDWVAGLVEREQMQDLAHTAERIARDRDPSARLPMTGREGRLAELTASLNRMLEQVDRALGRDRHLMREAAQELHAPVRALRRELAAPAEPVAAEPCAQHRMRAEVDRIARVLDEMEAVAGAGRPGAVLPRPVPLRPFLDGVARRAGARLEGRLTVCPPPAGATARIDPRWAQRALAHLLDNAAAHGRFGSPVELRAVQAAGEWRFEVADEGGGVPAGHEEAVFEPFYRLTTERGRPGLGLALVRGVAEAHGGAAGICNRPGRGATFWVRVPA